MKINILISSVLLLLLTVSMSYSIDISACSNLSTANGYYLLNTALNTTIGSCFTVNNTNITIDCNYNVLVGDGTGNGIEAINKNRPRIINCDISNFHKGIYFYSANNSEIINNNLSYNSYGIDSNRSYNINITDNHISYNNYVGWNSISDYNVFVHDNHMIGNIYYGANLSHGTNNTLFSNNDIEWNYDGLKFIDGVFNEVSVNVINNNDNDGLYFSNQNNSLIINNVFMSNGWDGLELNNGVDFDIQDNMIIFNGWDGVNSYHPDMNLDNNTISFNNHNGVFFQYAGGITDVSNNHISGNDFNGIITVQSIASNNYILIHENTISNNNLYGLNIVSGTTAYNNILNNSANFGYVNGYDAPNSCGTATYYPRYSLTTGLDCSGTNIIGGDCVGGNAIYNTTGYGFGFSDNTTQCNGNSSGICTNQYRIYHCSTWDLNDTYPLSGVPTAPPPSPGSGISIIVISPINNTVYNTTTALLTFYLDMDFATATCGYYLDGGAIQFIGSVNNDTLSVNALGLSNGTHNISLTCFNGFNSSLVNITNITQITYTGAVVSASIVNPANGSIVNWANVEVQHYLQAINASSAYCSILNLNGSVDMIPEISISNQIDTHYFYMAKGIQNLSVYCFNGTNSYLSDNVSFDVEPLIVSVFSPSNGTTITTNGTTGTVEIGYWIQSHDLTSSQCSLFVDTPVVLPPAFSFYEWSNIPHLWIVSNLSIGNHYALMYCQNSSWYGFTNITFNIQTATYQNTVNAITVFFDNISMIKFILSLIIISVLAYIGFRIAGTTGAIIIIIGTMIILSIIPSPPFIPLWITIISAIMGILGLVYTQNNR